MLRECGVVAEDNRKRKREKEKERMRKQRANITKEKNALLLKRRKDYDAMPKDKYYALSLKYQENYAAMPKDEKNILLLHSREKYANLTHGEQTALLLKSQNNYDAMSKDEKDALLLHSREKSREKYANLTPGERTTLLLKLQNNYAAMSKFEKDTLLLHSHKKYAAMPKDEKDTLLLHSREKYARCETYRKIKCTIEREALLAQMHKTTQRLRDAYTTDQMLQLTEQNAVRQREMCIRETNHDESTHQNIPAGRKCNIDNWNLSYSRYYDVGGLSLYFIIIRQRAFSKKTKATIFNLKK